MTLNLNKKHVFFQVERSQQILKTAFFNYNQRIKPSRAEQSSKRQFWNVLNVVLESFCFAQETKAVFISIRYPKTSQTQNVKSESTKRSLRKLAQPNRDSAFEQKHVLFQVERSEEVLKTIFCSYNQRKKQSSARKDIFGTYSTSFLKFCVLLSVILPNIFRKVCAKIIKTIAHNIVGTTETTFPKKSKAVFSSIRFCKTSQTLFAAHSCFFSNQVVGEVSGHQKTATSHLLFKKCFLVGKIL